MYRCIEFSRSPARSETRDFGVVDRWGRRIGASAALYSAVYVATPGGSSGWNIAPGTYFCFCPGATRNGEHYGAAQQTRRFATEDERDAAVQAYFAAAAKRVARDTRFTKAE